MRNTNSRLQDELKDLIPPIQKARSETSKIKKFLHKKLNLSQKLLITRVNTIKNNFEKKIADLETIITQKKSEISDLKNEKSKMELRAIEEIQKLSISESQNRQFDIQTKKKTLFEILTLITHLIPKADPKKTEEIAVQVEKLNHQVEIFSLEDFNFSQRDTESFKIREYQEKLRKTWARQKLEKILEFFSQLQNELLEVKSKVREKSKKIRKICQKIRKKRKKGLETKIGRNLGQFSYKRKIDRKMRIVKMDQFSFNNSRNSGIFEIGRTESFCLKKKFKKTEETQTENKNAAKSEIEELQKKILTEIEKEITTEKIGKDSQKKESDPVSEETLQSQVFKKPKERECLSSDTLPKSSAVKKNIQHNLENFNIKTPPRESQILKDFEIDSIQKIDHIAGEKMTNQKKLKLLDSKKLSEEKSDENVPQKEIKENKVKKDLPEKKPLLNLKSNAVKKNQIEECDESIEILELETLIPTDLINQKKPVKIKKPEKICGLRSMTKKQRRREPEPNSEYKPSLLELKNSNFKKRKYRFRQRNLTYDSEPPTPEKENAKNLPNCKKPAKKRRQKKTAGNKAKAGDKARLGNKKNKKILGKREEFESPEEGQYRSQKMVQNLNKYTNIMEEKDQVREEIMPPKKLDFRAGRKKRKRKLEIDEELDDVITPSQVMIRNLVSEIDASGFVDFKISGRKGHKKRSRGNSKK